MTRLLLALALLAFALPPGRAQESAAAAAPTAKEVEQAVRVAVRQLLTRQESYLRHRGPRVFRTEESLREWQAGEAKRLATLRARGGPHAEWPYEGVYLERGAIPPGYRVGGTAIAGEALLRAAGGGKDAARRKAIERAVVFVLDRLRDDPALASGFSRSYDVRGWGHAYALSFLLEVERQRFLKSPGLRKRVKETNQRLVQILQETRIPEVGGWNYSRPRGGERPAPASTFMTASTLLALFEAKDRGYHVDAETVELGLKALERGRDEKSGAFLYSLRGGPGNVAVPGACARMAICESALLLAGRSDEARVRRACEAFFEHWDELEKRRGQQGTHVGPYGIAPYYFHYGHTYVALAIELLPEEERPALRGRLRALYWRTRQEDGTWNDRIFPRSEAYCTAMAILGLSMPELRTPARWNSASPQKAR